MKNIIIIILVISVIYILYRLPSLEQMSNIDVATENKIREIYKIDTDAIRNLSNLAKDLTVNGKLKVPGGLEVEGIVKVNKSYFGNDPNGFLELRGGTPYIDFSHHETTNDNDNRIILLNKNLTVTNNMNINGNMNANKVLEKGNSLVPSGTVIFVAMNTAPKGYLYANGASLNKNDYSDLFNAIGYTFGGSGNNFNLPDLRGEFIRGWNNTSSGKDASRGFGSKQDFAMERITGNIKGLIHGCNIGASSDGVFTRSFGGENNNCGRYGGQNNNFNFDNSRVVKTSNETRPTNIALLPCIKI